MYTWVWRNKPIAWVATARRDIRAFPANARRDAGFELHRVQQGLDPDDWKPMPTIGPGVREIRIYTDLEQRSIGSMPGRWASS